MGRFLPFPLGARRMSVAHDAAKRGAVTRPSRVTPEHDLALQLPISFAGVLFKFISEFEVDHVTMLLRRSSFDVDLQTKGATVLVNIKVVLGRTERYVMHDLSHRLLPTANSIFAVHLNPKDVITAIKLVKTGCEAVRMIVGKKVDRVLIEGGTMRLPTEVGCAQQPTAKKAKKAAAEASAASPAPDRLWDSPADATIKRVACDTQGQALPSKPFDQIVLRIDAVCLNQKLGEVMTAFGRDVVDVTLEFKGYECLRHPVTLEIVPDGTETLDAAVSADEEGDFAAEEREAAADIKALDPSAAVDGAARLKPIKSWQPTALCLRFTAAGKDIDASQTFFLADRTADFAKAAEEAQRTKTATGPTDASERPVDWENDNEVDFDNPLGERSDYSLGLFSVGATTGELLAFPKTVDRPPEPWSYSGRHVKLVLGASSFSRYVTIHTNMHETLDEEAGAYTGVLWFSFPIDEGRAGVLHACVGRMADLESR